MYPAERSSYVTLPARLSQWDFNVESGETAIQQSLRFSVVISCFERRVRTCTTMKKHGSKPGQAVLMRYPHICGTVDAVQRQPTLIPLSTGIGCPDFLRSFEDMPPPPTTTNLEYPYAHSDTAVGSRIFEGSGGGRRRRILKRPQKVRASDART